MKKNLIACCLTLLLCLGVSNLFSQEPSTKKKKVATEKSNPAPAVDEAAMMEAWMTFMTPNNWHSMLAKDNGTWDEEITMWTTPDAPPTKSNAVAVNTMILGGRYQQAIHTGSFDGMPFEGISITGYDNLKKVFVNTWIDNFGTGIMTLEGPWDESTKSIVLKGKTSDPMAGTEMQVKQILKIMDNNHQVLEMYEVRNGQERKTMEIKLTRRG